jgi:peptide/nickel transport system ATP-binding protein
MNEAVRNPAEPIIEIENLSISFFTRTGEIPAVMDFSCTVMPGEAMGIVGESRMRQVDRVARHHARPVQHR